VNEPVFNLIDEPWIPMRRRSGSVETVPPWRVTDDLDGDPFVAFAWPRPDFNGAAHELLIGLLATSSAPEDDDEWEEDWSVPPSPEELQRRFSKVRHAFNLTGDGPRFMQDFEALEEAGGKKSKSVSTLLIDSPGDATWKANKDLFVKRGQVNTLGRAAAAMALFTMNSYAPQGGSGHRTSLRGGGPLTTLVIADHDKCGPTLWGRLWPNVETQEQIDARDPPLVARSNGQATVFPWLGPTRTSDLKHGGVETNQSDVAPLQVYWGMPRRIRLVFEAARGRLCDIMGSEDLMVISTFVMPKYGTNYMAGFDHPLTPYYRKSAKKTEWMPVHPEPGGINYRMYPGCVVPSPDGKQRPAAVVRHWQSRIPGVRGRRLLAFGYDMNSMKARGWLEGEMPFMNYPPATRPALEDFIKRVTAGAATIQRLLIDAIKEANWNRRKDAKGDFGFIRERLYRDTEAAFHNAVGRAMALVTQQPLADDPTMAARRRWSDVLRQAALALFHEYAPSEGLEDRNMYRHAKALHFLGLALAGHGRKGISLFEKDLRIPSPRRRTEAA